MPNIITLTGPSMCGKSTVIETLDRIARYPEFSDKLKIEKVSKYTTRPFRDKEILAVSEGRLCDIDVLPVVGLDNRLIGVSDTDAQQKRLKAFKKIGCDLVYEQYGHRYGVKLDFLFSLVAQGYSPIIVLNDVRAIEDIKSCFGDLCVSLFIFREVPNLQNFINEGAKRNGSEGESVIRYEKANAIYRIYIENIFLFDHLILNVHNDEQQSVSRIIEKFVRSLCSENGELV